MSIAVQCPNPSCGKVHRVKNRWAGKRGTCPDCGAIIAVPDNAGQPAHPPAGNGAPAPSEEMRPLSVDMQISEAEGEVTEIVADEAGANAPEAFVVEEAVQQEPDDGALKPDLVKKHFSGLAAVFFLLAIVGLGAAAAAPYLPGRSVPEDLHWGASQKAIFKEEKQLWVAAIPAATAALVLLGLVGAVLRRSFGFFSLLTGYIGFLVSAAAVAFWGIGLRTVHADNVNATVNSQRLFGKTVEISLGQGAWLGIGGVAAATVFLILAVTLAHRRTWAKVLFDVLAILVVGLAAALVFLAQPKA
jgi:hypothetical protein